MKKYNKRQLNKKRHPAMTATNPEAVPPSRYAVIDGMRGMAIALMIYFHFCYDLTFYQLANYDFYRDPYWLHLRTTIVSLFLLVSGISLHLATANGIRWRPYRRRLGILVICALFITIGSAQVFGERVIVFGILHFIAFASVLGLLFTRFYLINLVMGIALLILDRAYSHSFFDQTWIHWFGLMTHKPATEDYVPVIPWFGVVLLGMFLGKWFQVHPLLRLWLQKPVKHPVFKPFEWAGQHSLVIYLVHQPILFASLWLFTSSTKT